MDKIGILADIVTAGAAVTAAVVAVRGLSTWQHQLKGQSEYDLSRRILVTLFKYRDALIGVRHPAMWANEMPYPTKEKADSMTKDQIYFYGVAEAYQARWDKVQEQRTSLNTDLLESEAIWGADLKDLFIPIYKLQHELFIRVRHYVELTNPDTSAAEKEAIRKSDEKRRDILYDDMGEEPDEYNSELLGLISKVEEYLKPKLQRE